MGRARAGGAGVRGFTGVAGILGAIGVILPAATGVLPWLTVAAGAGLVTILVLAVLFHLARREWPNIVLNLALGALAAFILYGRVVARPDLSFAARASERSRSGHRNGAEPKRDLDGAFPKRLVSYPPSRRSPWRPTRLWANPGEGDVTLQDLDRDVTDKHWRAQPRSGPRSLLLTNPPAAATRARRE